MTALAAGLLVLASCSVKEIRDGCPVYVTVLTDQFVQRGEDSGQISFGAASLLERMDMSFLGIIGKGVTYPCPRDYARVSVLSGVYEGKYMEEALIWSPGRTADLLWGYGETFSVNDDSYVIDAVPHKQYCLIKFMFDESPTAPEGYPWRFRVRADHAGINIYTLEPVEGDYNSPVGPNSVGEWYGVLPRQRDNNMVLEIYLPYEDSETEGPTAYRVDLGKKFAEAHYDWTDVDLKDMIVKVGFADVGFSVTVTPWENDGSREVHI